jgi:hypothetical protein
MGSRTRSYTLFLLVTMGLSAIYLATILPSLPTAHAYVLSGHKWQTSVRPGLCCFNLYPYLESMDPNSQT